MEADAAAVLSASLRSASSAGQGRTCSKEAAQTYYAPPVTSAPPPPRAQRCRGPRWSVSAPDTLGSHLGGQAICFGQKGPPDTAEFTDLLCSPSPFSVASKIQLNEDNFLLGWRQTPTAKRRKTRIKRRPELGGSCGVTTVTSQTVQPLVLTLLYLCVCNLSLSVFTSSVLSEV